MKSQKTPEEIRETIEYYVRKAIDADRRGDVTASYQFVKSMEDTPGVSRAAAKTAIARINKAAQAK